MLTWPVQQEITGHLRIHRTILLLFVFQQCNISFHIYIFTQSIGFPTRVEDVLKMLIKKLDKFGSAGCEYPVLFTQVEP